MSRDLPEGLRRGPRTMGWPLEIIEDVKVRGTQLGTWVVDAPWAHMAWSQYVISGVHLKDKPGLPPAKRLDPRATHEVWCLALDPKEVLSPHRPWRRTSEGLLILKPINHGYQLLGTSDEEARTIAERLWQLVVDERLHPDGDFWRDWHREVQALHPEAISLRRHTR